MLLYLDNRVVQKFRTTFVVTRSEQQSRSTKKYVINPSFCSRSENCKTQLNVTMGNLKVPIIKDKTPVAKKKTRTLSLQKDSLFGRKDFCLPFLVNTVNKNRRTNSSVPHESPKTQRLVTFSKQNSLLQKNKFFTQNFMPLKSQTNETLASQFDFLSDYKGEMQNQSSLQDSLRNTYRKIIQKRGNKQTITLKK